MNTHTVHPEAMTAALEMTQALEEASTRILGALHRMPPPKAGRDAGAIEYDSWLRRDAGALEYDSWH